MNPSSWLDVWPRSADIASSACRNKLSARLFRIPSNSPTNNHFMSANTATLSSMVIIAGYPRCGSNRQ